MKEIGIEQYLYMDHNAYRQMVKNQRVKWRINKMLEIIKFLKERINGLNDLKKISEQKNIEQTVFFTLGATEAFKEILWKVNQYEQDEIDSLDKIIKEIKTLEWYFNRIKKNQIFARDWDFKQSVKHYCDKITFLSEKLLKQIEEKDV